MIRYKNVLNLATDRNVSEYDTVIFSYGDPVVEIRTRIIIRFLDTRVNLYNSVVYSGGCNNYYEWGWARWVKDRRTTLSE